MGHRTIGLSLAVLCFLLSAFASNEVHEYCDKVYRVNGNSIDFPCESTKNIYCSTQRYIPRNVIPVRCQYDHERVILALPRLKTGVPVTLGQIDLNKPNCYAHIKPFPCWAYQEEGNCNSLQSVIDLFKDVKGILWVLDSGITNFLQQPIKRCPPKVYAFNLNNGKTLKTIDLSEVVKSTTRLQYLVTDYDENGRPFVFVSDADGALISIDVQNNKIFRVVLPRAISAGCGDSDVLYLLLISKPKGQSLVIFSYLCGQKVYSIKSEHLRSGKGANAIVEMGTKRKHSVLLGTDGGNGVVLRYRSEAELFLWDTDQPYRECNFALIQNGDECRLSTHVCVGKNEHLFSLSSNLGDFLNNTCGVGGASSRLKYVCKECDDDCY
ncbi:protein yellow-like [Anopheles ziemanni]|uniref:protein yellow-like n=1 Tax=Anopheles coustani TaxID=139045 RepID=UPI002659E366|nr:protein yellow-like [Anopheles coustani]XP_058166822.1 protein yellow-like [Anopheles ziemanni]